MLTALPRFYSALNGARRRFAAAGTFLIGPAAICCLAMLVAGLLFTGTLQAKNLQLRTVTVTDPQMGGIPALRLLAPVQWKMQGGLNWNPGLCNLVTANIRLSPADRSAAFFIHPSPTYISGQIEYQWPQGQLYLGMYVLPIPNNPTAYLQQVLLPQIRPQAQNLRLVAQQELPRWANNIAQLSAQPGGTTQGYGVRARFAYTEQGCNWEEDFYCVVVVTRSNMAPQNLIWQADRNFSVRARAGKLDALQPLANAIINSFQVDKTWYARFVQVQNQWIAAQQQGIANAGALSRAISRSNDQISAGLMESWNNRQRAQDRASREFSEYIRGSENYRDPVNGTQVELPGGYDHAWTNAGGEYLLSNDAGFDPNVNANSEWTVIHPTP